MASSRFAPSPLTRSTPDPRNSLFAGYTGTSRSNTNSRPSSSSTSSTAKQKPRASPPPPPPPSAHPQQHYSQPGPSLRPHSGYAASAATTPSSSSNIYSGYESRQRAGYNNPAVAPGGGGGGGGGGEVGIGGGYGYGYAGGTSGEWQGQQGMDGMNGHAHEAQWRSGTPAKEGPHTLSLLSSLESQNESHFSLISSKVSSLKTLTQAIGDEIRDSTKLTQDMNDGFENTRSRLKGTMGRMLRMAERTGVGWRAWVGFFVLVWLVFGWVWLF